MFCYHKYRRQHQFTNKKKHTKMYWKRKKKSVSISHHRNGNEREMDNKLHT